jgi:hypothetical protein
MSKWDKWKEIEEGKLTKDEYREWSRKYSDRYREMNFELELLDLIKGLIDKGWIEVVEDNRKA